jgi:hypothetical protein
MKPDYKCKGSHVVMAAQWVDERMGPGTFKKLVGDTDSEYQSVLMPVAWYNVEALDGVLQQVARELHKSVEDITMEIARQNALKDLTTMYRIFLRIAAPVRVMGFTPRLWSTYVHFGDAVAIKNEPGHYIGECTGLPKHLLEWCSGAWRGFVPAAIELAGGREVRGSITGTWPEGRNDGRDELYKLHCEVRYH